MTDAPHLVMYRGDDRSFPFTITQDGAPLDLTSATLVFSAKADIDDAEPVFTLSSGDGGITIEPDQDDYGMGMVTVNIPHDATVDVARGSTLLCDIEVTNYGERFTWPEADYGQSTLIRLRIRADVTTE